MESSAGQKAPFDERAALEELERVREQIQRYRAQRRDLQDEFARFVGSFKAPPVADTGPPNVPPLTPPAARAVPDPPDFVLEPWTASASVPEFASEPYPAARDVPEFAPELPPLPAWETPLFAAEPEEPRAPAFASESLPPPVPPRAPSMMARTLVGGGLILLAGGVLFTWASRDGGSAPASAAAAAPVDLPAPPAPEPPAPAPSPGESELVTIRRVWMRVLVDGERVLEREVPADTRVPLTAQQSIVIRTGDAGAVRLSIRGEDHGFLGREGEVVTRTFEVPAPPER